MAIHRNLFWKILNRFKIRFKQVFYIVARHDVECNLCGYKANKLESDIWHQNCTCPVCGSGVRQRLLWATLTKHTNLSFKTIINEKKILHFAPETQLGKMIKQCALDYKTADYLAEGYKYDHIDFNIDISNMQQIEDESFDCVIACDVLEHVPDDIKAMEEVFRVLKNGGACLLTVPQRDYLKDTYEDPSICEPSERQKAYGQHDHLRIYGEDFTKFMEKCGFLVEVVDEFDFSKRVAHQYVLYPPILSEHLNATNFRKVFVGRKINNK